MDWPLAITRNTEALRKIVAVMFAMLHGVDRGSSPLSVGSGSSPLSVGFADTSPRKRGEVKSSAELLTSPLWGEVSAKSTERGLLPDPTERGLLPRSTPCSIANITATILRSASVLRVIASGQSKVCVSPLLNET